MAVGLVGAAVLHPACADTSVDLGAWRADFAAADSRLTLRHRDSGAAIAGTLSFVGPAKVTGDRHVTQGGVELKDQTWNDRTLTATVNAIGGFPMTVRFAVPEGFDLREVAADGAEVASRKESGGRILAVTLKTAETKDVTLRLTF